MKGWTFGFLKASRGFTRGSRPKMFSDATTVKFHRGQRWIGWAEWAGLEIRRAVLSAEY